MTSPIGPFNPPKTYEKSVKALQALISQNGWEDDFEAAVTIAHYSGVDDTINIKTLTDYYNFLNFMLLWQPSEDITGTHIYNMLSTMYFILDQTPVKQYQSPIKPNSETLTALSKWIVEYANDMGAFLSKPESYTDESLATYYNAQNYSLAGYIVPKPGPNSCFNDFFARNFIPGLRPIDGPNNPAVIVSAADSTFDGSWEINEKSVVKLKGIEWNISELLAGSPSAGDFSNGIFMHAFLAPYDYHRQHSPIDGTVIEARVIQAQAYLQVKVERDSNGKHTLKPTRTLGLDAPDDPGYQFLQTRGLIVIQSPNPKVGKVAVLPIGMAQVSSVNLSVQADTASKASKTSLPTKVTKGQEISYFLFGGSDICLVFQKGAQVDVLADLNKHYSVGQQIAIARAAL